MSFNGSAYIAKSNYRWAKHEMQGRKVPCNIYRIILWLYCILRPQDDGSRAETDKPGEYAWRFNRVLLIWVDVRYRRKITYTRRQQLMRGAIRSIILFVLLYSSKQLGKSCVKTPCLRLKRSVIRKFPFKYNFNQKCSVLRSEISVNLDFSAFSGCF